MLEFNEYVLRPVLPVPKHLAIVTEADIENAVEMPKAMIGKRALDVGTIYRAKTTGKVYLVCAPWKTIGEPITAGNVVSKNEYSGWLTVWRYSNRDRILENYERV